MKRVVFIHGSKVTINRPQTPRSTSLRGGLSPATARHRPPSANITSLLRMPLRLHAILVTASIQSINEMSRNNRLTTTTAGERLWLPCAKNERTYRNRLMTRAMGRITTDHMPMSSRSYLGRAADDETVQRGETRPGADSDGFERCASSSSVSMRSVSAASVACMFSSTRSSVGRDAGRCGTPAYAA